MSRKKPTAKQIEERQALAARLHESIAEQVEALRETEAWTKFLRFCSAFHTYSLNNILLILSQNPDATNVAGYRTWQSLGRQVRKGEKALKIFGGRDIVETVEDPTTGKEKEERRTKFFLVSVFDQSQTDLLDPEADDPTELAKHLTGDFDGQAQAIIDQLTSFLADQGWTVTVETVAGAANGYTTVDGTHRIVVDEQLAPAQKVKTLLHETAHALLHANNGATEYAEHRGICETEAESVAYVVAGLLGLNTADYSIGYVAAWSQADTDLIHTTPANVLKTANRIAEGLTHKETTAPAA